MSSYGRQTQSKAQTESNAKILRALVKQPDNKVCADCKRNDPRWASWNLGCFLCIRCSGIHRSMGTHISKVKSIDLDIWTPEQMTAIQKWGNRRANAYWEAHLKAGHVPPEHKVESFIRSKYEMRRWAKEGPIPSDPSELDDGNAAAPTSQSSSTSTGKAAAVKAAPTSALDLLGGDSTPSPATTSVSKPSNNLLDDFAPPTSATTKSPPTSAVKQAPAAAPATASTAKASTGGGGGLFDLDWHDGPAAASPSTTSSVTSPGGTTKGKNDILSLFASSKPIAPTQNTQSSNANGGLGGLDSSFGGLSMTGSSQTNPSTTSSSISDPWGASSGGAQNNNLFGSSDPWASSTASGTTTTTSTGGGSSDLWGTNTTTTTNTFGATNSSGNKNDAFADIWSDFK